MSNMLELFESNHKAATAAKKASPEYKALADAWLAGFQKNTNAHAWPAVAEKLLAACEAGNLGLVKDCFWASTMAAELDSTGVPAVVAWGMKRAVSLAHIHEMYDLLGVGLKVEDIDGESFYGGFPNPTEIDQALGIHLNKMEIF